MAKSQTHYSGLSLLWRTVLALMIGVIVTQILMYLWIQRSVSSHFEHMDSEVLTHAAFDLRQRLPFSADRLPNSPSHPHSTNISLPLSYDLNIVVVNQAGDVISSIPDDFYPVLRQSLIEQKQDNTDPQSATNLGLNSLWQYPTDQQFTLPIADKYYRAIIIRQADQQALIALPIEVHRQYLAQFNRELALMLLAITLLLVSIVAVSVYWGFAPLTTISAKMKQINSEQLDDRIDVRSMPSELRPLAESYNAMMNKLESNFETLARFSDDIAHELRTPLASLNTQTQVMLSQPRAVEDYIEQLHHQHETLAQLSTLINNMLLLAKTQQGLQDAQLLPIDLGELLQKLVNYYEWMAEERNIAIHTSGNFGQLKAEPSLLQRLFANLLSNAIAYAAPDSTLSLAASLVHTSYGVNVEVRVRSQLAQPLTQAQANKLTERFYRQSSPHSPHRHGNSASPLPTGTGLGLSIAQAIAIAHKGSMKIDIIDGDKQISYFEVCVVLPALVIS